MRIFFKESNFLQKRSPWGTAAVFTQKPRLWENPKNILTPPGWPYPYDFPWWFPSKGSPRKTHTHTQTSSQDRKWRGNIKTEQWRKENAKMTMRIERKQTRTHDKKTPHKQKKHQKEEKLEERRQQIQTMQAQETSWTERRLCSKHPNAKQQEIRSNKESLTPSKHRPKTWKKHIMFCGWKKSTKEKRNNDSVKGHIRKDPRKANKRNYVLIHCFPVQVRAGGPGEKKKHKMRKRSNKEKNHNNKNNQTRYMQRSRK